VAKDLTHEAPDSVGIRPRAALAVVLCSMAFAACGATSSVSGEAPGRHHSGDAGGLSVGRDDSHTGGDDSRPDQTDRPLVDVDRRDAPEPPDEHPGCVQRLELSSNYRLIDSFPNCPCSGCR
jgi:hypothetical protein